MLRIVFIFTIFSMLCACAASQKLPAMLEVTRAKATLPEKRVHFSTAGEKVRAREAMKVRKNAWWLIENSDAVVVLEGHCDERGGEEFNLELGDRRARSVYAMLVGFGVDPSQIGALISQGESRPADSGHSRTAWAKNRRVEFLLR